MELFDRKHSQAGQEQNALEATNENQYDSKNKQLQIELQVANITREDLRRLEGLLSDWAAWHKQCYDQEYTLEEHLLSGVLALDVPQLYHAGIVAWRDTLRTVHGTGQPVAHRAELFEEVEKPPAYDRAVDELLALPVDLGAAAAAVLPGGAAAARRRQLAEACLSDAAALDDTPVKRRRLAPQRCFNCGSYAHNLQDCLKPLDQARVNAARQEVQGTRNVAGQRSMGRRYFEVLKASGKQKLFDNYKPGQITEDLAQALGMRDEQAPPPWLSRMAVLGVPPRYQDVQAAASADRDDGSAADDLLHFVEGSDDGSTAEEAGAGQEDEHALGETPHALQLESQAIQPATDQSEPAGQSNTASNGARTPGHDRQAGLVLFPGINCPIPAGADQHAWQIELDKGLYTARSLTFVGGL